MKNSLPLVLILAGASCASDRDAQAGKPAQAATEVASARTARLLLDRVP